MYTQKNANAKIEETKIVRPFMSYAITAVQLLRSILFNAIENRLDANRNSPI